MTGYGDVKDGIKATGTYSNYGMQRWECWSVNQRTGEQRLLGSISYASTVHEFRDWERRIWGQFLGAPI